MRNNIEVNGLHNEAFDNELDLEKSTRDRAARFRPSSRQRGTEHMSLTDLRVLVAPDSFKGSATSYEAASAIASGWLRNRPGDTLRLIPMADGGEGTMDAFEAAYPHSRRIPVSVTGPTGEPVSAEWLLLADGRGVVELANTSGITLLRELDPDAHTVGFGQAIAAALDFGVSGLILGIGGSCSTDGGTGVLTALGARFLDSNRCEIPPGSRGLESLAVADFSAIRPLPPGGVVVITDVTSPLLGEDGAAAVFGAQKGISAADIPSYELRLAGLAEKIPHVSPDVSGAGAAGGTGFGLHAWGAELVPGARAVAHVLGIGSLLPESDLLITGEGCYDGQSAAGKVPTELASLADAAGIRTALVAGSIRATTDHFIAAVSLAETAGSVAAAMSNPSHWLNDAGAVLALHFSKKTQPSLTVPGIPEDS